jgi:uncharacterized protein
MIFSNIIIIFGLALFEIVSSIDNAIINAHVLKVLPDKYRRFFLTWGLFIAVFLIRGGLPFLLTSAVSESRELLLLGGGVYLFMVFLGWLFMEEKKYAFLVEEFVHKQAIWFYAFSSLFLTLTVYFSVKLHPVLALSASIGATAFFITDGFRKNAEHEEEKLMSSHASAISKILFLEILDASFSIDGVIGAFAFTLSIPLIILGNGLGAIVVREFTIHGGKLLTKFAYLKNGAMYSVGCLGMLMVLESFGSEFPFWVAPLNTFILLAVFLGLSMREISDAKLK